MSTYQGKIHSKETTKYLTAGSDPSNTQLQCQKNIISNKQMVAQMTADETVSIRKVFRRLGQVIHSKPIFLSVEAGDITLSLLWRSILRFSLAI